MAKQTQFHVFLDGGAAIPVTFPTATVAKSETSNTQIVVPNTTVTVLLAQNLNAKFRQIINNSGSLIYISFGSVPTALSVPVPNLATWTAPIDTLAGLNRQEIKAWQVSGGNLNVNVYEEQ